jgi:hypothetical protein
MGVHQRDGISIGHMNDSALQHHRRGMDRGLKQRHHQRRCKQALDGGEPLVMAVRTERNVLRHGWGLVVSGTWLLQAETGEISIGQDDWRASQVANAA